MSKSRNANSEKESSVQNTMKGKYGLHSSAAPEKPQKPIKPKGKK